MNVKNKLEELCKKYKFRKYRVVEDENQVIIIGICNPEDLVNFKAELYMDKDIKREFPVLVCEELPIHNEQYLFIEYKLLKEKMTLPYG